MNEKTIENLLDFFNGYEVQNQLMSEVGYGKSMKSLTAVTTIYTSMPSQVHYIVRVGENSQHFVNLYAALVYYKDK
jgi:hypothetical protein